MQKPPKSPLCLPLDGPLTTALATLTQAIGSAEWFDAVLNLLGTVCDIDSGGAMMYHRHQRPRRIVHRFNPQERSLPEDAYISGPYVLCPNYQMFIRGCPSGVYWLRDIAPDDFYDSEFYRVFYSQIGLSDSIDLLWRLDDDTALNIFIERSISSCKFQAMDMLAVESLMPMIFASATKHHELTAAASRRETDNLTHRKVQSTMENFASSLLTQRERQVLFYMISGYSSALTAERLNTTEGTIKIHRKNIHKKLDISSQAELFSLFINCIAFATPEGSADPLTRYQSTPAAARPFALQAARAATG
ncbi:LuxR C-terminal-related transcriptional regulator [Rhodoferax sp. U2-2l]|uniref:LuxR C-terminal-related transcriptional regulator n=1 Tax=Rhodoferax sp. U2-2l TaxID=2884000 RepID=UPI001D0A9209|nr:LuxR C-terminal-related transcriptional regulator [Rhodoferax sp. U2-2l]MCB8745995.1 LuxR C-terminal-related transcriptional regulator [Rhodoferax sp. U2-2l]